MRQVLRVFGAEGARLLRLRGTFVLLLLLGAVSALRAYATAAAATVTDSPIESGTAWAALADGWRAGLVLGTLLLVALSARGFAGDLEHGVLRLAATRSVSRPALLLGRFLLGVPIVVALVASTGLAAWAAARVHGDFGPLVEDGYEIFAAHELAFEVRMAVLSILPALLATVAFGLAVACLARNTTTAVGLALGAFLGFDLFKELLGESALWVFATHVPTLADTSAWSELGELMRGYSDAGLGAAALRAAWITPGPTLALFLLVGGAVLTRRTL